MSDRDTLIAERARRIYYQNIVYAVCTLIDGKLDGITMCGTWAEPSTEVQDRLRDILSDSEQS